MLICSGAFDSIVLPTLGSSLVWDTSQLYTTGALSVAAAGLPGDYNQNGSVDAGDYVVWRKKLGSGTSLPNDDTPGVGADEYTRWRAHYGQPSGSGTAAVLGGAAVPEPTGVSMLLIATTLSRRSVRRRN